MPSTLPADRSSVSDSRAIRIVGLGASAGGLEPLVQFLAHVPPRSAMAYIVVQHLDPTHKPLLSELLRRSTTMPVIDAAEGMIVRADTVYVIPPDRELTVKEGVLHVRHPDQPRGLRLPIDILFSSLARDQGERAVGVVLSGMGSDGTLGLTAIRSQGGLTLAQSPESALFDAMPKSAIAAGCVDIVAPPSDLPRRIAFVAAPRADMPETAPAGAGDSRARSLNAILALLHERSRHDLSQYKPNTLLRRIERRIAVHGLATMEDYAGAWTTEPGRCTASSHRGGRSARQLGTLRSHWPCQVGAGTARAAGTSWTPAGHARQLEGLNLGTGAAPKSRRAFTSPLSTPDA